MTRRFLRSAASAAFATMIFSALPASAAPFELTELTGGAAGPCPSEIIGCGQYVLDNRTDETLYGPASYVYGFLVGNDLSVAAYVDGETGSNAGWSAMTITETDWNNGVVLGFDTPGGELSLLDTTGLDWNDYFPDENVVNAYWLSTYVYAANVIGAGETRGGFFWGPLALAMSDLLVLGDATDGSNNFLYQSAAPAPVPIPAALPLLLSALGGLGFFGWRRRRALAA